MGADAVLDTVRSELSQAVEAILTAAARGLARVAELETVAPHLVDAIEQEFCAIIETCAVEDIVGQRLNALSGACGPVREGADPLLNGPAAPGEGLDQADADALFDAVA